MLNIYYLSSEQTSVLRDAVELHKAGLEAAMEEIPADGTIEDVNDLLEVTADVSKDIRLCDEIMERINDHLNVY